jgi:hypothetical protein
MVTNLVNRGLLAAIAASALALVALVLTVGSASANPGSVSLSASPGTIEPNGTSTVGITVTPSSGEVVGGVVMTITFDDSLLEATSCSGVICNLDVAPGEIAVSQFAIPNGLSGQIGSVLFTSKGDEGSTTIEADVTDCQDAEANAITCTGGSTTVTVATATPTPTPSPTPSASASPAPTTPKALPSTGGLPGDSDGISVSSALLALLAVTGLVAVSGAVWATSRARRVN